MHPTGMQSCSFFSANPGSSLVTLNSTLENLLILLNFRILLLVILKIKMIKNSILEILQIW